MKHIEMQMVQPKETYGIIEYHLSLGNKHLLVSFNRLAAFAETELTKTDELPMEGATTALYMKARELLQQEARSYGPITYRISTGFTSMKSWLQTTGNAIFHWESAYSPIDDPQKIVAETIIRPR